MALKIKRKTREPEEIPLASTSDIAFLLIIFFLTASALLEFRGVQLPLPKKDAPPMQILRENIFKVKVDSKGDFYYNGQKYFIGDIQKMAREAYDKNRELVVVLRIDPKAPSEVVPGFVKRMKDEQIVRFAMGMENF